MEFEFTGRHVEITPAIQRLARKELEKLGRILDSAPMRAHIILTSEKYRQCTEIIVYWRDSVFAGQAQNSDLNQSISTAAGKVQKQVLRLKEKFKAKKRKRVSVKGVASETAPAEASQNPFRIIPARRYRVKPMTPEEAATLVQDSADHFIVFRDAETNKVGVLYKRKDKNFGLIEL
jgi:putative sigma-54 modulation protein